MIRDILLTVSSASPKSSQVTIAKTWFDREPWSRDATQHVSHSECREGCEMLLFKLVLSFRAHDRDRVLTAGYSDSILAMRLVSWNGVQSQTHMAKHPDEHNRRREGSDAEDIP